MHAARIESVHTLSVSLGKLDLDLTPANPFAVQVVKSVLCVSHIFKRAVLLRPFIFQILESRDREKLHTCTTIIKKQKKSLTAAVYETQPLDLDQLSQVMIYSSVCN